MVQAAKQAETTNIEQYLSTTATNTYNADYSFTLDSGKAVITPMEGWLQAVEMTANDITKLSKAHSPYSIILTTSGPLGTAKISKAAHHWVAFDQLQSRDKLGNRTRRDSYESIIKILSAGVVDQPEPRWSLARGFWSDITENLEEDPILAPTLGDVNADQSEELSLPSYGDVIERAISLEQKGYLDSALDLIVDALDELFRRGQFAVCDSILIETNVDACSSDILVTILTVTARAKSHLAVRPDFVERTKQALDDRGDLRSGVLDGLE